MPDKPPDTATSETEHKGKTKENSAKIAKVKLNRKKANSGGEDWCAMTLKNKLSGHNRPDNSLQKY